MAIIHRLTADNFMRLVAVEIEPDGNVVIVSGANAQGKTSVLNAIMAALGGPQATKAITEAIRDGEDHANVFLDLGEFTVERTWERGKNPTLAVKSKEGRKYSSPQQFLNEKLGALTFDPLAFTQMDARTQLKTLLGLVDLPFDPVDLEGRRQSLYDQRTEVGREVKSLQGQLDGLERIEEPDEDEQPASAVVEAYAKGQDAHATYNHRWQRVRELEGLVVGLEEQLETARFNLAAGTAELAGMADLPDLDLLKEAVDTAEERNAAIRTQRAEHARWAETKDRFTAASTMQHDLTATIQQIEDEKATALAKATMPIKGLSFDQDGVTYQGLPFSQASSAEQLRVSLAMAIAMNPEIRICRITDGSLLDSKNMALIVEMADKHNFQVWVEKVDESGELGFVIEEGQIKAQARGF